MKIRSIEAIHVRADMAVPRGPSILTYHVRESIFIKLATDDGLVGWGETYPVAGVRAAIVDVLAPLLVGCDAMDAAPLNRKMLSATFNNGLAVGGVSLALDDVRGKALGVPLHALYGGAMRDRAEAYASLPGYYDDRGPAEHWVDEAQALISRGFRGMKFRIGRSDPPREMRVLAAVRNAVGPDTRLMADANAAYSAAHALRVARELTELSFDWLEEPLPQSGYSGYPELRSKMELPLAGGETLTTRHAAHEVLQRACFDIIQPDVSICGGIAECLFVGELAQLSAVRCVPHCWAGAVTLAATLQLCCMLPEPSRMPGVDAPRLEYDVTENPFRDSIVVGDPFALRGGCVALPTSPGLGVEIDEHELRRYAV